MKVTTLSHPFVFESFRNIDFDNGAINYLEPALEEYSVPTRFESVRLKALCPKADQLCNEFFEADGWRDGDVI